MRVAAAFALGCLAFSLTGVVILVVMVTFSVHEIPNWSLGPWFLWGVAWADGSYFYLRRHEIL